MAERAPTPSVLLELREERQVVQEGYRFLDEKRLLLAAEVLRRLREYEEVQDRYQRLHRQAMEALAAATARHGLQGVQLLPPITMAAPRLTVTTRTLLNVKLARYTLERGDEVPAASSPDPSPEARRCTQLFGELLVLSAQLAGLTGTLERLLTEYRRTARRTRALEDVLLPEVERELNEVATRLEENDQEEAVRVRLGYQNRRNRRDGS